MRILEKHVIQSYVITFLFCIVLLMVLGVIGDILGFLDDIFKNNIPLPSIMAFYFYFAPFAFVNMVPFACLLGAVYVFNNLSKNHELTATITSGLSMWRLIKPVMFVTVLICMITFIINDRLVPGAMQNANRVRLEKLEKVNDPEREMTDLAIYGEGGQMIYARSFIVGQKMLKNVIIHRQDDERRIVEKVTANSTVWQDDGTWMGEDVIVFKVDDLGNFKGDPEIYKKRGLLIKEAPDVFINNQWDPKFMSYKQLKKYLKVFGVSSPSTLRRLSVDLNYKLAFPFTALVTVLVGIPFSVETGRSSALAGMARGITIPMLYLPVMAVSLALGKGGILHPIIAAWASMVVFAWFGARMVKNKS